MPLNSTGFWAWAWNGATITPRAKVRIARRFIAFPPNFCPPIFCTLRSVTTEISERMARNVSVKIRQIEVICLVDLASNLEDGWAAPEQDIAILDETAHAAFYKRIGDNLGTCVSKPSLSRAPTARSPYISTTTPSASRASSTASSYLAKNAMCPTNKTA